MIARTHSNKFDLDFTLEIMISRTPLGCVNVSPVISANFTGYNKCYIILSTYNTIKWQFIECNYAFKSSIALRQEHSKP